MKLFIQSSAEQDILRQIEWYSEQGLPDVARRFGIAVRFSVEALLKAPFAGSSRSTSNPQLADLRTWPVAGFDAFRVYYIARADDVQIVRILHGRRDVDAIVEEQDVEGPPEG